MVRHVRILAVFTVATALLAGAGRADLIWSDDFTGQPDATFPNRDFNGNLVNDWTTVSGDQTFARVTTATGEPAPSLAITDPNGGSSIVLGLAMTSFAPFSTANPATPILRLSFDWKVSSFLAGASTIEAMRVILRANGSSATGNQLVLGFNRADLNDGDGLAGDLTFYAASPNGTSNIAPTNTSAIGMLPGVGWQPGFDFGQYDGATTTANDSDDLFYHFDLAYDFTTGGVEGTVSRIAPDLTNGQSAAFTFPLNPGLVFSNTDSSDVLLIASTNVVTGESHLDNIAFESVPEPSSAVAFLCGLVTLGARRRRR